MGRIKKNKWWESRRILLNIFRQHFPQSEAFGKQGDQCQKNVLLGLIRLIYVMRWWKHKTRFSFITSSLVTCFLLSLSHVLKKPHPLSPLLSQCPWCLRFAPVTSTGFGKAAHASVLTPHYWVLNTWLGLKDGAAIFSRVEVCDINA